ncbi:MAG: flagellin [Bdellovibrionaceae bacterium]|nr:flagellin [Pseudobdellovibrionaceae bacterium]
MLRIAPYTAVFTAQRSLNKSQMEMERAMKELASGTRFVSPGADPAGYAIAENIRAQLKGFSAARSNVENATSFVQLAEAALNEQNNILIRLRELAVQAASDTFSETERGFLDEEFRGLVEEFDRIAKSTKYGSQSLLDGTTSNYEFQVGVHKGEDHVVRFANNTDTRAATLDIDGLSVSEKDDARDSLEAIDKALVRINAARAKLGAVQSRMNVVVNHLDNELEAMTAAHSRAADADIASAVSTVRRNQVLQAYQAQMLAEANAQNGTLISMIS